MISCDFSSLDQITKQHIPSLSIFDIPNQLSFGHPYSFKHISVFPWLADLPTLCSESWRAGYAEALFDNP